MVVLITNSSKYNKYFKFFVLNIENHVFLFSFTSPSYKSFSSVICILILYSIEMQSWKVKHAPLEICSNVNFKDVGDFLFNILNCFKAHSEPSWKNICLKITKISINFISFNIKTLNATRKNSVFLIWYSRSPIHLTPIVWNFQWVGIPILWICSLFSTIQKFIIYY